MGIYVAVTILCIPFSCIPFFSFSLISGVSIDRVFLGTKLVMKVFLAIHVLYGRYISQVPTWVVYDLLHVGKL